MTKHHLLTIKISADVHMHTYLMAPDDRRYVAAATNKMFDQIEKLGLRPLPIVLVTELNKSGVKVVRATIDKNDDEASQVLATATDFHVSMWMMTGDHPDNASLMKLH
jgi:hypothetical protein